MFGGPTPRRMGTRGLRIGGIVIFCLWSTTAPAQQLATSRAGNFDIATTPPDPTITTSSGAPYTASRSAFGITLASAALPGAGQLLMRQRRGAAYLLFEAAGLAYYVSQSQDGRRERDRYKSISRNVARAAFSPNGPGGDWDYYERMAKFGASGDFDKVPGGVVDPEPDEQSYNGAVWLLARQTFWRDPEIPPPTGSPEYSAALAFYSNRAMRPDMAWSWAGQADAYRQFRGAIAASNSAFRSATTSASVIIANHFLSAIDAYVSVHLKVGKNDDGSVSLSGSIPFRY